MIKFLRLLPLQRVIIRPRYYSLAIKDVFWRQGACLKERDETIEEHLLRIKKSDCWGIRTLALNGLAPEASALDHSAKQSYLKFFCLRAS